MRTRPVHCKALILVMGALSACTADSFVDEEEEHFVGQEYLSRAERAWQNNTFEGDLSFRLSWSGRADLDAFVTSPRGETISYANRAADGAAFTKNACGPSCGQGSSEEISWVEAAPSGVYSIFVERYDAHDAGQAVLEIFRDGAIVESYPLDDVSGRGERGESSRIYEFEFENAIGGIEGGRGSAFDGALAIQLVWEGSADLDLFVQNPDGIALGYNQLFDEHGGEFSKGTCLREACPSRKSEETIWESGAKHGEYKISVANYNGEGARRVRLLVHSRGELVEERRVDAPLGAREDRRLASVFYGVREGGGQGVMAGSPESVSIASHRDEQWIRGRRAIFDLVAPGAERLEFTANGEPIKVQRSDRGGKVSLSFSRYGEQTVALKAWDGDGRQIGAERLTLVVTESDGALPRRRRGHRDVSRALLAKKILASPGINLWVEGRATVEHGIDRGRDAGPRWNIRHAITGKSMTSCYGTAPCDRRYMKKDFLQAILMMNRVDGLSFSSYSMLGGSHSKNSRHYLGAAIDINKADGTTVSTRTRTVNGRIAVSCRRHGATELVIPPRLNHTRHVHCGWPRESK